MESLEQFLTLLFKHTPDGSFYFSNEINKQVGKPFPRWANNLEKYAELVTALPTRSTDHYFSPAVYNRPTQPTKGNVKGASCVWVDCDDGLPEFETAPNLLVESSPGRYHAYWLLDHFAGPAEIEAINKSLAYKYNTDKSGWDATQLLRPPGSFNRRRGNYRSNLVSVQPDPIATFEAPVSDDSVKSGPTQSELAAVLARTTFPQRVLNQIFKEESSVGGEGRSGLMFKTACELLQLGLSNSETEVIIGYQDARLHKFEHHADAKVQVENLVKKAREKVGIPTPVGTDKSKPLYSIWQGNKEFLQVAASETDDFIIEHTFYEQGMVIIGGEPGAGKSRLALQMVDCIACGKPFLGKKIKTPRKCAYISLDMNNRRVRDIRKRQMHEFTDVEQELIEQNVLLLVRGYGLDLTNTENQMRVQEDLVAAEIEVVFIDVLARSVPSMLDDKCAVAFLDWIQALNVNRGMSFVFITHTRKGQVGSKGNTELDDFYGSRHWSIPPDHCFTLANIKGEVRLYILKDRSGELGDGYIKLRKDYAHSFFHLKEEAKQSDEGGSDTVQTGSGDQEM